MPTTRKFILIPAIHGFQFVGGPGIVPVMNRALIYDPAGQGGALYKNTNRCEVGVITGVAPVTLLVTVNGTITEFDCPVVLFLAVTLNSTLASRS
jgi:hypothetical protein